MEHKVHLLLDGVPLHLHDLCHGLGSIHFHPDLNIARNKVSDIIGTVTGNETQQAVVVDPGRLIIKLGWRVNVDHDLAP